jgi:hypothetical protein
MDMASWPDNVKVGAMRRSPVIPSETPYTSAVHTHSDSLTVSYLWLPSHFNLASHSFCSKSQLALATSVCLEAIIMFLRTTLLST